MARSQRRQMKRRKAKADAQPPKAPALIRTAEFIRECRTRENQVGAGAAFITKKYQEVFHEDPPADKDMGLCYLRVAYQIQADDAKAANVELPAVAVKRHQAILDWRVDADTQIMLDSKKQSKDQIIQKRRTRNMSKNDKAVKEPKERKITPAKIQGAGEAVVKTNNETGAKLAKLLKGIDGVRVAARAKNTRVIVSCEGYDGFLGALDGATEPGMIRVRDSVEMVGEDMDAAAADASDRAAERDSKKADRAERVAAKKKAEVAEAKKAAPAKKAPAKKAPVKRKADQA